MKINKTEISCLANKLARELNDELNKRKEQAVKNYTPSPKYKKFMELVDDTLSGVAKISKIVGTSKSSLTRADLSKRFILKELGLDRVDWVNSFDIQEEIIIAQIECPSLDAIIEKIKKNYLG